MGASSVITRVYEEYPRFWRRKNKANFLQEMPKKPFSNQKQAENKIAPRGFEPLLPG